MAKEKPTNSLSELVKKAQDGRRYISSDALSRDPETAAIISKLVRPIVDQNNKSPTVTAEASQNSLNKISSVIQSKTNDTEDMMLLFPDLELAAQILVSSIISPKDMMNTEIIYSLNESHLPSNITANLLDILKKECDSEYNLSSELYTIIKDALFLKGAHIKVVLPESSLDELINGSANITLESLASVVLPGNKIKPLGILGSPDAGADTKFSFESFANLNMNNNVSVYDACVIKTEKFVDKSLEVSDNWQLLKMPSVIAAASRKRIKDITRVNHLNGLRPAIESIRSEIFKPSQHGYNSLKIVKTKEDAFRKSIGRPLILTLPTESVIPVCVPGDEKTHTGYFILIDEEGNPVSKHTTLTNTNDMGINLSSNPNRDMSSMLLDKARRNISGDKDTNINIDNATQVYSELVEANLINRIKNGVHGANVQIANSSEIYRMMLGRSLANQFTRMVFVPAEMVSYFANKFSPNGVGKSLLEDMRITNGLRAMTMFARIMASLKNSIGVTEVKLKLDPRTPDPAKAIEKAVHEVLLSRQQNFPLGLNSPADLANWVQSSGFEFTFEGHPGLPDMGFEFNQKASSTVKPDTDLDEELKKRSIMGLGLPPELVDNGFASEFATTVTANNIMLAKRVLQAQEQFTPIITAHVKRLASSDMIITSKMLDVIRENSVEIEKYLPADVVLKYETNKEALYLFVLEEIIDSLELSLPNPTSTTLNNQMTEFDNWLAALDKALDSWISGAVLKSSTSGDLSNNADDIKEIVRAYYIRDYLARNNILTELNDLVSMNDEGEPKVDVFEMNKTHISAIMRSTVKFLDSLNPAKIAANKDLERLGSTESSGLDDSGAEDSNDTGESLDAVDNSDAPAKDEELPTTDDTPAEDGEAKPDGDVASPDDAPTE